MSPPHPSAMLAAAVRARAAGATWRSGAATTWRGGAATPAAWRSRASGRGAKAGAAATAAGAGVGGFLAAVRQDDARCAAEAEAETKAETKAPPAEPAASVSSDEAPTREDAARYIPLAARIGKIFAVKKAVLLKAKAACVPPSLFRRLPSRSVSAAPTCCLIDPAPCSQRGQQRALPRLLERRRRVVPAGDPVRRGQGHLRHEWRGRA